MSRQVQLGMKVRDTVTGFAGIVTGRTEYLAEHPILRVTAETGQEDAKERWFAQGRCEEVVDDPQTGFAA